MGDWQIALLFTYHGWPVMWRRDVDWSLPSFDQLLVEMLEAQMDEAHVTMGRM